MRYIFGLDGEEKYLNVGPRPQLLREEIVLINNQRVTVHVYEGRPAYAQDVWFEHHSARPKIRGAE